MAEVQTPGGLVIQRQRAAGFVDPRDAWAGSSRSTGSTSSRLLLRIGMVVGGLAAGAGLLWLSSYGHEFVAFAQAARVELRKVVWPTRDETLQDHLCGVRVSRSLMGLFFFVLDWILTWMTRFLGGTSG